MSFAIDDRWRRVLYHSAVVVGLVFAAYLFLVSESQKGSVAYDIAAYYSFNLAHPYQGNVGDLGFFAYSPPIALLLAPFHVLPWLAFVSLWYTILLSAVVWLGRWSFLAVLAFPPVAIDLYHGNIHLLLAVAIALGFRYPAAWSVVLLTKVTPGIGLLWFAVRREWRQLAIALGVTGAIVAVTLVTMPSQWAGWISMLVDSAGTPPPWPALPIPLTLRLPIAALIVVWGARTNRRWTVPLSAALSVPALWPGSFAIMAACWRLAPDPADYHAPDVLRSSTWLRALRGAIRPGPRPA
jgi:Glycosyltransferase family 87